jgi:hypothetical protein
MIEIYDQVWVDPYEVRGVYLRKLREEEMTVVLLNNHEIRLPGNHATAIKDMVTKAVETE